MKLLFTGESPKSGSFQMRAVQIAEALGAKVGHDFAGADITVAVKRISQGVADQLRGRKWAWDVVDAYPQPTCSSWSREECVTWARRELNRLQPHAVIWPTERMRDDVGFVGPQAVIPHHHRIGVARNPIRARVQRVGYEGHERYIAPLRATLDKVCARHGAAFVCNPESLADVDVVVALRGAPHDGYAQRHWKSGVKLANAHATGTPFIGARECGYLETASGAEYWADTERELDVAMNWLASQSAREQVSDRFVQSAYSIERAAAAYRAFFESIL